MAQKILILGNSGTGKSASLRNFAPDEIAVINCAGKPLPFKNHFEQYIPKFDTLTSDVLAAMDRTEKKVIVVDDAQYIMSFQYMRRIHENGWDKWNDIQGDFFNIIQACDYMPNDVIVYFLSHIATDDNGNEKIKTMGKMLDEKITIEGLFTTVLKTSVQDGKYYFLTQNSGRDTVKSPIGMFDTYAIDNDLKYVDTKIRNYYEIGNFVSDSEVKAMDEIAAAPEIEKPDADGRKRRRGRPKKEDIKDVDKGTGAIVGATLEEQKELENEEKNNKQEKPEQTPPENAEKETTAEKPKRRRKTRDSEAGITRNDTETVDNRNDTASASDTNNGVDTAGHTKRRRKKREPLIGDLPDTFEQQEEDIPF